MTGIKETKELVVGLNEIVLLLAVAFKDGVQAKDAVEVWDKLKADPILSAKILEAYNGVDQVAIETKDISLMEGVELAGVQLKYLPQLIEALGKKA